MSWDLIFAGCVVIVAIVVSTVARFSTWNEKKLLLAVLWVLTFLVSGQFAVRIGTVMRIETRGNEAVTLAGQLLAAVEQNELLTRDIVNRMDRYTSSSPHHVGLILDPEDIWLRAQTMINASTRMSIIETTSLQNSSDYERQIRTAAANGAEILRVVCASPASRLENYFTSEAAGFGRAVEVLHFPTSAPIDILVAETGGSPNAIIGFRQPDRRGDYVFGIELTHDVAVTQLRNVISDYFVRKARLHMQSENGQCEMCRQIRTIETAP